MPKQNFDGLIEITLQGSNDSIPIKSSVSSTVESLKKVWNEYFNCSDELCCVFDGFLLENNATLVGLGVVGGDSVLVFSKKEKEQFGDIEIKKRSAEEISVGLNVLIGEDEGLEVLEMLDQSNTAVDCGPLFSKKMSLLKSEETLLKCVENRGLDVNRLIHRFICLVLSLDGEFSILKEDIEFLLYDQENIENLKDCKHEIFEAIQKFWIEHYQLPDSTNIDYDTVFIGPERNANFSNYLAFPPTVQLRGVTWNTCLRDLMESYQEYSGCNINTFEHLFFNNESYSLDEKVFDVYIESLARLSVLPAHQHFSFSFDISTTEDLRCVDDLVNFIEGSDEINSEGRKRKKKRKKKGQTEDNKETNDVKELEENEMNIEETESRIIPTEIDTQRVEMTMKDEKYRDISQHIVNEIEERKISLTKLEDLKKQFELEIEQEKRNLEENDRDEKKLLSLRERDARLILQIGQIDQDISNMSNGISSCDSEIHDLEMRLKRVRQLKDKLSERQSEKMKKIRKQEEEKRNLTQKINTEAVRCFDERTKTYNRIDELKKKLLSAIKDIEHFDSRKDFIYQTSESLRSKEHKYPNCLNTTLEKMECPRERVPSGECRVSSAGERPEL